MIIKIIVERIIIIIIIIIIVIIIIIIITIIMLARAARAPSPETGGRGVRRLAGPPSRPSNNLFPK